MRSTFFYFVSASRFLAAIVCVSRIIERTIAFITLAFAFVAAPMRSEWRPVWREQRPLFSLRSARWKAFLDTWFHAPPPQHSYRWA